MDTNNDTPRIKDLPGTNAHEGVVLWSPAKSFWYLGHLGVALVGGFLTFSLQACAVFIAFTALSLCLGHSLGMHRRLIHNSYDCPKWLEYLFVHLGVLVGMAGPFGMIRQHDMRDWAQRKAQCHAYLRHGAGFWKDAWWQLNCDIKLRHPPRFVAEDRIKHDALYHFMERTWMLQQLPWALLLFCCGGIAWVIWGISARVAVSVTGHWLIGYFAHNRGERDWHVEGASVQGHNVKFAGLITMGESWHNNHHAYPGSALLGIYKGQSDPGWWVLNRLMNLGLVWDVKLPADLPHRPELQSLSNKGLEDGLLKTPRSCPLLRMLS